MCEEEGTSSWEIFLKNSRIKRNFFLYFNLSCFDMIIFLFSAKSSVPFVHLHTFLLPGCRFCIDSSGINLILCLDLLSVRVLGVNPSLNFHLIRFLGMLLGHGLGFALICIHGLEIFPYCLIQYALIKSSFLSVQSLPLS